MSISPDISTEKFAAQPRAALNMFGYSWNAKSTLASGQRGKGNDLIAGVKIESSAGF
jgi:hypothetical protein